MDRSEASALLHAYLEAYRARSHDELQQLLMAPVSEEITGPDGKRYQVLVQASWPGAPGGDLRVVGGIDDRGWQEFSPLVQSFTVPAPGATTDW